MYSVYERLRNDRSVKDADVSKATGIPQATLSEWKRGDYTPKVDKIMLIAQYFGVPLETFLKAR